ncbi:hypothetical protein Taro_055264 [Colocasia esculenta]|uniref:Uncharacterized protein n=1 Tax=Colocasia esculenta TaxID=4460 RepID=A0A843XTN6_COLES|nr:hypothetical protein [Colocasia esculenta]
MDNNGMSQSFEDTAWALPQITLREAMTQMIAPSSDIDAESHTQATPEGTFISVMGKDRPGRIRCAGNGEMLGTWYRSTGTPASSERGRIMQEQLKAQEEKLKAQAEEMTQMQETISRLENVATKVDEMSELLSQIQASQLVEQVNGWGWLLHREFAKPEPIALAKLSCGVASPIALSEQPCKVGGRRAGALQGVGWPAARRGQPHAWTSCTTGAVSIAGAVCTTHRG